MPIKPRNSILQFSRSKKTKKIPKRKKGFKRIYYAFLYSINGLHSAMETETSFQQEFVLTCISLPLSLILPCISLEFKLIFILAHFLILVTELLNTGLEAIVDKVSPEFHDLAKRAKDMGSAAVLVTFVNLIILWLVALAKIIF